MGAIGALTNALNDALAPFGVVATEHPLTPMSLRNLLRGREAALPVQDTTPPAGRAATIECITP